MAKLIILTGAGLSAESGLRTFRDDNGLWENHPVEKICNGKTWRSNFELVRQFYNDRRTQLATAEPNAAHLMIARWQSRYETVLLTQNVDDLLERAGCSNVVHLHGFLPEMCCAECGTVWNIGYNECSTGTRCPECRSIHDVRPHIVFFGEQAPNYFRMWRELDSPTDKDALVIIGTSGKVLPAGEMARCFPGLKILNNLTTESYIDESVFNEVLHMPATNAVGKIDSALTEWFDQRKTRRVDN